MMAELKMNSMPIIVAIDGPAGAGKSTVAKGVSKALDYQLVDTGAIYRAVALVAKEQGIAVSQTQALVRVCSDLAIRFEFDVYINRVFLNGRDVTDAIRTPEMSQRASRVSAVAEV